MDRTTTEHGHLVGAGRSRVLSLFAVLRLIPASCILKESGRQPSFTLHHVLRTWERVITWLTTGVWNREADLVQGMERTLAALKADVEAP